MRIYDNLQLPTLKLVLILRRSPLVEQNWQQCGDGFLSKSVTKAQIVSELNKFLNSTQFTESTDKQPSDTVSLKPVRLPELAAKLRQEVEVTLTHLRATLVSREIKQFLENLEVSAQEHQSTV